MRNGKYFLEGVNMTESQIIIPETIAKTETYEIKHRRNTVFNSQAGTIRQLKREIEEADFEREIMGMSWKNSARCDAMARDCKKTSTMGPLVRQDRKYAYQSNTVGHSNTASRIPTSPRSKSYNLPAEQRELLKDFHGSMLNNLYNIFVYSELIRQCLPRCEYCSSNLENVLKMDVCQKCKFYWVCRNCMNGHKEHETIPILSILYHFQKESNNPSSYDRIRKIKEYIKEVDKALYKVKMEAYRLEEVRKWLEDELELAQKDRKFNNVAHYCQKLLKSLAEGLGDHEKIRKNIQEIISQSEIYSKITNVVTVPANALFPLLPSPTLMLSRRAAPHLWPIEPVIMYPLAILMGNFRGREITLNATDNVSLRYVDKLRILCDGYLHLQLEKVRDLTVDFKDRRMDSYIRALVDLIKRWSIRRNQLQSLTFRFDFRQNGYPTTENSNLLTNIMSINVSKLSIELLNARDNQHLRDQLNQLINSYRYMRCLYLSIKLSHLHSQSTWYLYDPYGILNFIKSLGSRLNHLTIHLPIEVDPQIQKQIVRYLASCGHLTECDIQLGSSNLNCRLRYMCRYRKKRCLMLSAMKKYKENVRNSLLEYLY